MYKHPGRIGAVAQSILLLAAGLMGSASSAPPAPDAGSIIRCPYVPTGLSEVPTCAGSSVTCMGTDGHDLLWADEAEVIYGGGGNDVIKGSSEDDIICGGPGNDAIHAARGNDVVHGDDGTDWLFGGPGEDTLVGGSGDFDVLWGGPDFDHLDGGEGIFDYCLQQRDEAQVSIETCEVIFPPIGFDHEAEEAIPPGLVSSTIAPSGRGGLVKIVGAEAGGEEDHECKYLFVTLTSGEVDTQILALTMTRFANQAGKATHVLLCGAPVELAVQERRGRMRAPQAAPQPRELLKELIEQHVPVYVCSDYLLHHGLAETALTDGVTVADWARIIEVLMSPGGKTMEF